MLMMNERPKEIRGAKDALLTEYEVCLMDVSQLDSDIWQSGSIFLALSLVGISLLVPSKAQTWFDFFVHLGIAVFGLALLFIWRKLVTGWLHLINVNIFRMREIEIELDMWRERYIGYLDGSLGESLEIDKQEPRWARLRNEFRAITPGGPPEVHRSLDWLVLVVGMGWVMLVIKHLVYVLTL
jgi:hypothetical protein